MARSKVPDRESSGGSNSGSPDVFGELLVDPSEPIGGEKSTDAKSNSGLRRLFTGNRALWIVAIAAVVSLVAGLVVGRFVISPADAASQTDAPEAGLITVPVEFGELSNDVTIRGDIGYADATEVTPDTSSLPGPAVVTGQIPAVGAELAALSIALELAGRPVIVLPGELPAYRNLRVGESGPDVVQFKWAMRAVGLDAGDPASDVFDAAAANAVGALYTQIGYPGPPIDQAAVESVRFSEQAIITAQQSVASAQAALNAAQAGPSAVDVQIADNAITAARAELSVAEASGDQAQIALAQGALRLAQLQRDNVGRTPDTSAEQASLSSAHEQVAQAQADLAAAQQQALPYLPAGEVLYLSTLPRRVAAVSVTRGQVLQGVAMTVSGASLLITGSAAQADASLLTVGDEASFPLPDGSQHRAVISEIKPGATAADRWTVLMQPDALTPEQIDQLQGSNVRVSVPVGATVGEVLSVPVAALTAGPGGESRVEVVEGDPRDGKDAETRLVVVETGLAAAGVVEVTPVDDKLEEGDLVVVGR